VLEEAWDRTNPILERLKFLAITASNLDEFFQVRVSHLREALSSKVEFIDASGMTLKNQLEAVTSKAREFVTEQYSCLNRSILPTLEKEGICFLEYGDLSDKQAEFVKRHFETVLYPVLTPQALDPSRPFPLLNNKSLNLFIELDDIKYTVMQIPTNVNRILELPAETEDEVRYFILIEEIIRNNLQLIYMGFPVKNAVLFRLTRDTDIEIDEDEADDLLVAIEKSIKDIKWGNPVRLELEKGMPKGMRKQLTNHIKLNQDAVFEINGILDLTVFMAFSSIKNGFDGRLEFPPFAPKESEGFAEARTGEKSVFDCISERDILVHHPYESFSCVLDYIEEAAYDPDVLAIKQTLYRVSGDSPVVDSLIKAATNGKQVTVLVELKARFDEEKNIIWAKKLEKAGCHVVYGLIGLKTHCKICLVVRREPEGIKRYIHLGTGNYNDSTAKVYTDISYFTCRETFGQDISVLFNVLTGYSNNKDWNKIAVAPHTLREMITAHIKKETENARNGIPASITWKLNSLVDTGIIQLLYDASKAGVVIKLLVRGICCLKPGIEGLSDNITVSSIIDRFLEHSRIYRFENGGTPKLYLSSADMMPRNLDRRVEVAFPIEDKELAKKAEYILQTAFADTVKLRLLNPDGSSSRVDRRGKPYVQSQEVFHALY
jgi:polyphosphate kinase